MILVPEYEACLEDVSDEAWITLALLVLSEYQDCPVHQFGLHRAGVEVCVVEPCCFPSDRDLSV
jgi:hypothetical protein